MTKFKGPVFPSYLNQQTPQARRQWISHCGTRARLRYLRQACKKILESPKGSAEWTALQRVLTATVGEPMPEFGKLHLINAALEACDQTGEPWHVCMNYMMDKFDDMQEEEKEVPSAAATA